MLARLANRIRRLGILVRREGLVRVLHVTGVAVSVPLLMRLPLRKVQSLIEPSRPPRSRPTEERVAREVELVSEVLRLGWPLVRRGCLIHGVTHYYFLRRIGEPVELAFGMEVRETSHDGHCWLTRDGEPFLERTDPRKRYTEVCRIPHLPDTTRSSALHTAPR